MKIAYNPKTAAALTTAPANNDITFDLSGLSIYVKGVRFKGTDTTYSVFKKHGSSGGGYNGLVPVPSYNNDSKNRYLREDGTWVIPTHYTTHLYVGAQSVSNNNNSNASTTNGNTYIKLFDDSTLRHLYLIKGYGNTTVNSDASGNITINSPTTISWDNVTGKPESFIPSTHYHDLLTNWPDTRSVATTPNDYNAVTSNGGVFKVSGIKTAGTTLGLTSTLAGTYATIIGWRGWKEKSGGYAWEIASTDKNRLYVRSGFETTWNNGWSAIAYTTDNFPTSQINKLTGYTKATAIASLSVTDTLNTALGKLEFKTDFIYNDLFGTDNDDVINKWHEIVDFVDSVTEGTDILDEFVTRKTVLTITGAKTFNNQTKFGGDSKNGSGSVYLWENATYRNPGSYIPQVFIRNDNASTGINGFQPALLLYNNDGALNSTIGIEFGTLEQKNSSGTVNGAALGGIIAIKESEGSANRWSLGGLDFFVKNNANRIDALYINHLGNIGIGTTNPSQKLHVNGNILAAKFITSGGTSSLFVKGDGSLDSNTYATSGHTHNYASIGSVAFTPANTELTPSLVLALTGGWSIKKGTWNYAGNGYIVAGSFGNIDLAGTSVLTFGNSGAYTQLYITAPAQSGHSGKTNEIFFYNDHGSSYFPGWTRVITNRNYTDYVNTTNFPGLNKTGTVTSVTVTGTNGLSGTGTITTSGTITLSNSGVRSTTINGNYLRVNTNGANTDLTIPYATKAKSLTNYYSSRPTTINPGITGDGGMFQFKCTSSVTDTTTNPGDGHILHFNWDNTGGYDAQLFLSTSLSALKVRGMNGGTWRSWATVLTDVNSLVSGGGSSWGSSITVNLGGTSKTLTIPSKPTLSVITSGSGNAITNITVSDHTLTLKKETNFASGQDTAYIAGGTAGARWVRIASTSSYNAFGIISICNSYYDNATTSVTFVFNTGYTNSSNPSITLIGGSRGVFTKARIVKGNTPATSETAYIEIYYNTTSTHNTLHINLANARNTSLYTTYTEGSIPTNYVTFERNFIEDGFSGNGYYKQGSSNSYVLLGGGGDFGLHTGRNNEANKVVRTDASGYIYAGWINTTSGDMGTTGVTKIYCSNDDFIRYKTPGQFFSTLANDANLLSITVGGLNRKLTISYANSAGTSSKVTVTDSTTKYKILGANGTESLSVYRLTATVGSSIKPIYLSGGVPTECSYSFKGLSTLPVVLVSGYFYRNYLNLNIWYFDGYKHSEIGSPTFSVSGGVMTLTFSNTVNVYFISACAQSRLNFSGSGKISTTQSVTNTEYSYRSEGAYWFNTYVSNSSTTSYLYIRSYRLADANNDSWGSYASSWKLEEDAIQSVSFTIFGYI